MATEKKVVNFTEEVKLYNTDQTWERFKGWKVGCYCGWGCGPGWQPLLYKLCTHIENTLDQYKIPRDQFVVAQVKEKFGTLRFYWEFKEGDRTEQMNMAAEQIHELVTVAEEESAKTCEYCGQPGTARGGGWIKVQCDDCEAQDVHWRDVDEILSLAS